MNTVNDKIKQANPHDEIAHYFCTIRSENAFKFAKDHNLEKPVVGLLGDGNV